LIVVALVLTGTQGGCKTPFATAQVVVPGGVVVVGLGTVFIEIEGCCEITVRSLLLDPVLHMLEGTAGLAQRPVPVDPQLQTCRVR